MLKRVVKSIPGAVSAYEAIDHIYRYIMYLIKFNNFIGLQKTLAARFGLPKWSDRYPCLDENTATTSFDAHYTYHPAWAARIISQTRPSAHVDISSTLNFCAIVSAFVPVDFYDYRPARLELGNLSCRHGDLMKLPFEDESVVSLSCMHVVEHVGLGRYGDPLDPDGDLKAIVELKRILANKGSLLFVVPIGRPRIQYNAHRIYSYDQVVSYFVNLSIQQFALVDDSGRFIIDPEPAYANQQNYGCGCWWFKK
jgi:SAM-dependent methyltransferase